MGSNFIKLKLKIIYSAILFALVLFGSCAKMGSLTGGPKDETPPKVVESKPENYSVNFKLKKIEITFDEFILLNNINQELIVSPPLKERPEVRLKNKTILIDLNNELRDSTTYTLNFGEAIKDNNEGNLLSNFEFVFSTGDFLDSLGVGGTLLNAFDLKPPDGPVGIMLYNELEDSVVFREIPVYIGKTDDEGHFRINNLKGGKYKLFALKDVNNNFLFDLPNESIAFADSFLNVSPEIFLEDIRLREKAAALDSLSSDSLVSDSTILVSVSNDSFKISDTSADSLAGKADSLQIEDLRPIPEKLMVDLFLFTEENQSQFLNNNNRKDRNKIEFSFNRPVADSFSVKSLIPEREDWYLVEKSAQKDSFIYWIIDKEVREKDTILLELNYIILDSMEQRVWKKDSVYFNYREPAKLAKKKESESGEDKLIISGIRGNSILDINTNLKLISNTPVNYVDTSLIRFNKLVDSLKILQSFDIARDSIKTRILNFQKTWEPKSIYELVLFPGAVMDVFGSTNDTLKYKITIRAEDYYGVLIVNMDSLTTPTLIQLMNLKDKVLKEHYMDEPGTYRFEYLKADKYKLKFILDDNQNKKWDTGKYILKRQPEKVEFYKGEIDIRSNWDLEVKYR